MAAASALAGLVIASFGVGLQWVRLFQGGDISEPLRVPPFVCGPCPPRFEDTVLERRLFLLELATSPGFGLELVIGYVIDCGAVAVQVWATEVLHLCLWPTWTPGPH